VSYCRQSFSKVTLKAPKAENLNILTVTYCFDIMGFTNKKFELISRFIVNVKKIK